MDTCLPPDLDDKRSGACAAHDLDGERIVQRCVENGRRFDVGLGAVLSAAGCPPPVHRIVRRAVTVARELTPLDDDPRHTLQQLLACTSGNRTALRAAQAQLARRLTDVPGDDLGWRALRLLRAAEAEGTWAW